MIPHPDKPAWPGPYDERAGVTHSGWSRWLENPFGAYLYFYCGLKPSKAPIENLQWGDTFHVGLEHYIQSSRGKELTLALHDAFTAMYEYMTRRYPTAPEDYFYACAEMLKLYPIEQFQHLETLETEHEFCLPLTLPSGRRIWCRGKVDVKAPNFIDDHKCKGSIYPIETTEEIWEDTQMNFYQKLVGGENWIYDLIQIPQDHWACPSRRRGESADAYAHRLFHTFHHDKGGFPIVHNKYKWICPIPHHQPTEANELFMIQTMYPLLEAFCVWWDYINTPTFDPNNPECYNMIFYKHPIRAFLSHRTDKWKDSYHGVLTGNEDYSSLVQVPSFYPELSQVQ